MRSRVQSRGREEMAQIQAWHDNGRVVGFELSDPLAWHDYPVHSLLPGHGWGIDMDNTVGKRPRPDQK